MRARCRSLAAVVCATTLALVVPPRAAQGQARGTLTPSVTVTAGVDENPTWTTVTAPDVVGRVSPGLTFTHKSPLSDWFATYEFTAQQHRDHASLNSPVARQHAFFRSRFRPSPFTTVGLTGGFDTTLNPTDLNLETALAVDPIRAYRTAFGGSVTRSFTPRASLGATYEFAADALSGGPRLYTHAVDVESGYDVTRRDRVGGIYRARFLSPDDASLTSAHAMLFSYARRLTPATTLSLAAGPRIDADGVAPDLDLEIARRAPAGWDFDLSYARTRVTTLGVRELVALERARAGAAYRWPRRFEVALRGGFYESETGDVTVRVYRVGADVVKPLGSLVSLLVSGHVDWQRGRLATIGLPVASGLDPVPIVGGPDPDPRIRRGVVMVGISISPRFGSRTGDVERLAR